MSFARPNRGRSLYGHADPASNRERELMAENNLLREKNKRLSDAILTLVDHIENKLPQLEQPKSNGFSGKHQKQEDTREHEAQRRKSDTETPRKPSKPKVEIFESYEEPIEFAEPAPQMRFGRKAKGDTQTFSQEQQHSTPEYVVSPDLEPEEIDLLKSPTRMQPKSSKMKREKVDVVDLQPKKQDAPGNSEFYEASTVYSSEIPSFKFNEEEPVVDIDMKRRETLRAAMRRRVNRLRW
jgi:hypothetical protein